MELRVLFAMWSVAVTSLASCLLLTLVFIDGPLGTSGGFLDGIVRFHKGTSWFSHCTISSRVHVFPPPPPQSTVFPTVRFRYGYMCFFSPLYCFSHGTISLWVHVFFLPIVLFFPRYDFVKGTCVFSPHCTVFPTVRFRYGYMCFFSPLYCFSHGTISLWVHVFFLHIVLFFPRYDFVKGTCVFSPHCTFFPRYDFVKGTCVFSPHCTFFSHCTISLRAPVFFPPLYDFVIKEHVLFPLYDFVKSTCVFLHCTISLSKYLWFFPYMASSAVSLVPPPHPNHYTVS